MKKKGQVTLFVILGIIIIVAGILIYQFVPGLKSTSKDFEENPNLYIQSCLEETLSENIELISTQGGSVETVHPYLYNGTNIDYLCYTEKYFEFCQVERPLLISHVEKELKKAIEPKLKECFTSLVQAFESKGYTVNYREGNYSVFVLPKKVEVRINNYLSVTKGETKTYDSFVVLLNKNLYEVLSIAYNILNWEAVYGDADIDLYMDFSPAITIEKIKRDDGTKIYMITTSKGDSYFQFASRSLVLPPGYGAKAIAQQK